MNEEFRLSGLGDAGLEDAVCAAVTRAGYSGQEMADFRIPLEYSVLDYRYTLDNLLEKLPRLNNAAVLRPDSVFSSITSRVKLRIKKILSKLFRWYIIPLSDSQSCFNCEISLIVAELVINLKSQETEIREMRQILNGERDNDV